MGSNSFDVLLSETSSSYPATDTPSHTDHCYPLHLLLAIHELLEPNVKEPDVIELKIRFHDMKQQ